MRTIGVVFASVALALGLLFLDSYVGPASSMRKAKAQTVPARPNFVFILADDMRKDDLAYMPKTRSLLKRGGMSFENAFVSHALCAPSRATIMRGQYAHNTHVLSNSRTDSPSTSFGGWQAYRQNGNEADNVATRLQRAGYRTGLFGKYLNGYDDTTLEPPPGWNRWFGALTSGSYHYFNYDVNVQGTITHYGTSDSDYSTDVISRETDDFISSNASQGTPFFAYVAPIAPHAPATPAPGYAHAFDGESAPRLRSFDEADVTDKPLWMRKLPRLTPDSVAAIDKRHENRIESLQSVDDLVEGVVNKLNTTKTPDGASALDNTYVFFTSDNGFHHGEHRIPSDKWRPYEEDVHMPLLVRGPGVAAGSATYRLALNTDYMPTFLDLACSSASPCDTRNWSYVSDGRTLEPVLHGSVPGWRRAVLLEAAANHSPAYKGIRTVRTDTTTKSKYVEYADGARELYRLGTDPFELTNRYNPDSPPNTLAERLQALKTCTANATPPKVTCKIAEDR